MILSNNVLLKDKRLYKIDFFFLMSVLKTFVSNQKKLKTLIITYECIALVTRNVIFAFSKINCDT